MENTKGEVTVTGEEGGVTVVCLVMESLGWHLKVFQLNTTPRKKKRTMGTTRPTPPALAPHNTYLSHRGHRRTQRIPQSHTSAHSSPDFRVMTGSKVSSST